MACQLLPLSYKLSNYRKNASPFLTSNRLCVVHGLSHAVVNPTKVCDADSITSGRGIFCQNMGTVSTEDRRKFREILIFSGNSTLKKSKTEDL